MDVNQSSASNTPSITPEMKKSIIDMLLADKSVPVIAKEYSIPLNTLYQWRSKAKRDKLSSSSQSTLSEKEVREKLSKLEKDYFILQQKNEILKKALLILGENTK